MVKKYNSICTDAMHINSHFVQKVTTEYSFRYVGEYDGERSKIFWEHF